MSLETKYNTAGSLAVGVGLYLMGTPFLWELNTSPPSFPMLWPRLRPSKQDSIMMQSLVTYLGLLVLGLFFIALATSLVYGSVQLLAVSPWLGVPAFFLSIWIVFITGVAYQVNQERGGF